MTDMNPSELRAAWEKTTRIVGVVDLQTFVERSSPEDWDWIALAHREWPRMVEAVEEVERLRAALEFYRDSWTFYAVGDEGDGVTDFGRFDGYEAEPNAALRTDGGQCARAALSGKDEPTGTVVNHEENR